MFQKKVMIPITMVIIAVSIFVVTDYRSRESLDALQKEFPTITTDDNVNSRIEIIYRPGEFRNSGFHAFLIFSSSEKATLKVAGTLDPGEPSLDDVLAEGDSIFKASGSSEIMILKNDTINYPQKVYKFRLVD